MESTQERLHLNKSGYPNKADLGHMPPVLLPLMFR